jgi:hypothetical protein
LNNAAIAVSFDELAPADAVARIAHLSADRKNRIYIAGPMTGLPEYNFPAFNAAAKLLRAAGWHVENPAEHGHVEGAGWSDYLRWDLTRIATVSTMYLLPGWKKSKGARLEVTVARELGIELICAPGAEDPSKPTEMKVVATIVHVPYSPGFMMSEPEPARDELVWGERVGKHLVMKTDAEAAISSTS